MLQIILDDTKSVPQEVHDTIGVGCFSAVVANRRSRLEAMQELVHEFHWPRLIHLRDDRDVDELVTRLDDGPNDPMYLVCPSHLVPTCGSDELITFLKQIEYAPSPLYMPLNGSRPKGGWTLMGANLLQSFLRSRRKGQISAFFDQDAADLVDVPDRLKLVDLSDAQTLQDFLSGQLDSRHFNTLERDDYTLIKRSTDRTKLKKEFDFYELVPPAFRMFLVQPFDFKDDGHTASYRMERLGIPDMAVQWINNSLNAAEFAAFLDHIFYFFSCRPERNVPKARAQTVFDEVYLHKVTARITNLKTHPVYEIIRPLFDVAFGGIDSLVDRYVSLLTFHKAEFQLERLVIGHGDPCFSNILYSKSNQILKLIDPRGASSEVEAYTDPYYDIAKLSHSVAGQYDFINQNIFSIDLNELKLRLTAKEEARPWAVEHFRTRVTRAGFDFRLTRLCEASLFISMLPLHIDRPQKVLAFALRAQDIIEALESGRAA